MTVAIASNRFGLGARPDEPAPADPKRWLLDQFGRYDPRSAAFGSMPDSRAIARDYGPDGRVAPEADEMARQKARQMVRQEARALYQRNVNARLASTLTTPAPFAERLVHFWSNHFAISADKARVVPFAGAYEAEAIRPHVMGRFEDMLVAVQKHAGMQYYLDQAQSVGPNSMRATNAAGRGGGGGRRLLQRAAPAAEDPAAPVMPAVQRVPGLNENLAREILELHTLGVRSGYSQADVTEFARALTGWSTGLPGGQAAAVRRGLGGGRMAQLAAGGPGIFQFRPGAHEPGTRTVMGRTYAQQGEAQGLAILHDLAVHPATADHIALKLARHFVADDPPKALVRRLSDAFNASGGDLPTLYRTLVDAPESWSSAPAKFKTPWDWLVSSLRGVGLREVGDMQVAQMMRQLGQPVWQPGSPAGFDDVAASWAAPDALVRRVEMAQRVAARVGDRVDPRTLAPRLLADSLTPATRDAVARAESLPTGLALLLVSPDFQRR